MSGQFFIVKTSEIDIGWVYFLANKASVYEMSSFTSSLEIAEARGGFDSYETAASFLLSSDPEFQSVCRIVNRQQAETIDFDNECNIRYAEREQDV